MKFIVTSLILCLSAFTCVAQAPQITPTVKGFNEFKKEAIGKSKAPPRKVGGGKKIGEKVHKYTSGPLTGTPVAEAEFTCKARWERMPLQTQIAWEKRAQFHNPASSRPTTPASEALTTEIEVLEAEISALKSQSNSLATNPTAQTQMQRNGISKQVEAKEKLLALKKKQAGIIE